MMAGLMAAHREIVRIDEMDARLKRSEDRRHGGSLQ
jgi:hypothetical protein